MDINRNNYEPFFLLYVDGELNPADKHAVEKFLSENVDLQKEFIQLQQTIFTHEEIRFEPKELLFRKEEKRRTIPLYWVRIAAAILLIMTTGWFVITMVTKNHIEKIGEYHRPAIVNAQTKKIPVINSYKNDVTNRDLVSVNESTVKKNSGETPAQKKILRNTHSVSRNVNDKLVEDNADRGNSNLVVTEESPVAKQKSSQALEVQTDNLLTTSDTKQVSAIQGATASALAIVPVIVKEQPKKEDADLKGSEYQTDNSISVISLDDRNKSITGFFKKLTKTNPDNNKTTNTRKIHVSVFQFSY